MAVFLMYLLVMLDTLGCAHLIYPSARAQSCDHKEKDGRCQTIAMECLERANQIPGRRDVDDEGMVFRVRAKNATSD
jgi:hypothetical protein